jgi:ribonuclease HI
LLKNGWTFSLEKPVENQNLWVKLLSLAEKHKVTWQKNKKARRQLNPQLI